ncbi:MAG: hypothetical protein N5P05_001284 [Chroococcopsis gigantea SAG 12.99]|nr:hypothetical protein [Chroococcopsis gigantea SAG 12.99]
MTNLYKYLPGNVGHLYARIKAVNRRGVPIEIASLSVLLEPLLMAASALFITILSGQLGLIKTGSINLSHFLFLGIILMSCHPIILNGVIRGFRRLQKKELDGTSIIRDYPFLPLGGEIIFVLLRGVGFLMIWQGFSNSNTAGLLSLLSAFSFAWLLGLIVPGAPGGLGVFEATMIALLDKQEFFPGTVLLSVGFYRVISILAEVLGAGVGVLWGKCAPDAKWP